jgi:hypothetical protein
MDYFYPFETLKASRKHLIKYFQYSFDNYLNLGKTRHRIYSNQLQLLTRLNQLIKQKMDSRKDNFRLKIQLIYLY